MDQGSHTLSLAFNCLASSPRSVSARAWTLGDHDTEDNLACSVTFERGAATALLSWTAGVRKVIYTLHGDRGAIRVEDDSVEVSARTREGDSDRWSRVERAVSSSWGDASHSAWFRALHQQFAESLARREIADRELGDALRCVALIEAAYASAGARGAEVTL